MNARLGQGRTTNVLPVRGVWFHECSRVAGNPGPHVNEASRLLGISSHLSGSPNQTTSMRIPGLKSLRSAIRWSRHGLKRRALVLGYHRIADEPWDPHGLCVSPGHFVEQLEVLKSVANPIPLRGLVSSLGHEAPPRRGVVLTFDDGYLDNLTTALPALQDFGVPATVFVATGWMGREFWWEELTRLVGRRDRLDQPLEVRSGDQRMIWRPRGGDVRRRRGDLLRALSDFARGLDTAGQDDILRNLRDRSDVRDDAAPRARGMTAEEVTRLADTKLVEIGSHTVSHPCLSDLPEREQREEVKASKDRLEDLLGRPVKSFCYPNGAFTQETARLVRETGYDSACTILSGPVVQGANPYALPRVWAPDIGGEAFRRWLARRIW